MSSLFISLLYFYLVELILLLAYVAVADVIGVVDFHRLDVFAAVSRIYCWERIVVARYL